MNISRNIVGGMSGFKRSWFVASSLPVEFTIKYSANILSKQNGDLLEVGDSNRRLVVVDEVVWGFVEKELRDYFEHHKIEAKFCVLECTEETKNRSTSDKILVAMEEFGLLRRSEPVIAIGGGVLLDIVGYAASLYRRGVPYIRVPTTLLSLVDASVGVKTGINHFDRRNRLGSYYAPVAVYLDRQFVRHQPPRDISNGLGEILKMAIIKDPELFDLLHENADILLEEKFQFGAVPVRVINRAISGMVEELAPNLWEKKLDRCVDFGHSFSPMVEMNYVDTLMHGEAVTLDCLFSSCIAYNRGMLKETDLYKVFDVAARLGLKVEHPGFQNPELLWSALSDTTKHRNGDQNLPLPDGIGNHIFCNDFKQEELQKNIDTMMRLARGL